jgi:hypothetical protein
LAIRERKTMKVRCVYWEDCALKDACNAAREGGWDKTSPVLMGCKLMVLLASCVPVNRKDKIDIDLVCHPYKEGRKKKK